jgi:predicted peptidase
MSRGEAVLRWTGLLVLVVVVAVLTPAGRADEPSERGFINKVFKGKDGESKYVVFVPHDYKGDKEYPIILFLHGAGERGEDGLIPVKQGIGSAIKFKDKEKTFPFFVVFPQCKTKGNWKAGGADADRALAMLDEVQKTYKIDTKRVYLTGLSMGGGGTWSLAAAYPERWAAIVPICGGGDPESAEKIKNIPCWCFVGDKDSPALVKGCRNMIESLKKAGGEPRYSEYPFVGHNSWDSAYVTPELYPWLLSHKLK